MESEKEKRNHYVASLGFPIFWHQINELRRERFLDK